MTQRIARHAGLTLASLLLVSITACDRHTVEPTAPDHQAMASPFAKRIGGTAYDIDLTKTDNGDGTWTWVWTITNTNPGNGSNGTSQNLSHWNLTLGQCLTMSDIVSAAVKGPSDPDWVPFIPMLTIDGSTSSCYPYPTVKFNLGTVGSAPSYYRLVIRGDYDIADVDAVFKSGKSLPCLVTQVPGVGCPNAGYARETAWGYGPRFVPQGNWAMYFTYDPALDGPSKTVPLIAGQYYNIGTVTIGRVGTMYTVTYTTTNGWTMTDVAFHLAPSFAGLPKNTTGNPIPGQFIYNEAVAAPGMSYTKMVNYTGTGIVYIAAHANVMHALPLPVPNWP
ncbi:MAG: hypothetical protein QHI48_04805 [Bacteroidota bacterium]|nr:hypothetical protein [Bacteroidota bacterium]